ncbi:MAG: histidine triad nucleotide-binding protein [Clostridiales bacterium]|nr:MAG: histidine triad nucleotide-binding protein [Clostridiales bacterium]
MNDCIFCKIVRNEIPSKKVYEDETVLAFYDLNPAKKVHILIIPKAHIANMMEINDQNSAVIAHIFEVISRLAKELKLEKGFRVVSNCNEYAGQSVFHLHFHLLGGEPLSLQMC